MEEDIEEAVKGWIAYAMEFHGYAPWEIREILEAAYRYQHGAKANRITPEDAVKQYRYYRPKEEVRQLAEQEAAVTI